MKKFVKISLITAGILFLAGCLLGGIGAVRGKRELAHIINEKFELDKRMKEAVSTLSDTPVNLVLPGIVISDGDVSVGRSEGCYQVEAATVKNLCFELGAGTFEVEEKAADDGMIDICFEGLGECDYEVKEETLYIAGFKKLVLNQSGGGEITVKIPEGYSFGEVDVEIGAGTMTVEGLTAKALEMEIGAGELEISELQAESFSAKIGAGELNISETSVKDAEISVSMGECVYEGAITGNLDADCDMGNLELKLAGKEEDHNYEIECGAGNVEIGDFEFAALGAERKVDNQAESTYEINCSLGNVVIEFEE